MDYCEAMKYYGCDKPDMRFDLKFVYITELVKGKGFKVFDDAQAVIGFNATGLGEVSKKKITQYTDKAKSGDIGAKGLVYIKCESNGEFKSSVDKFYNQEELKKIGAAFNAKPGDFICIFSGDEDKTRVHLGRFRLFMADELKLRDPTKFAVLWVVNFPLLEYDEEEKKWNACHHPFTCPFDEDIPKLFTDPGSVRAKAYDMVINGWEVGGGSIRIYNRELQQKMFERLGLSAQRVEELFGFFLRAFEFGAPPHGGLAFGYDRLVSLLGGVDNIRPFIAFPKNKEGRDTMIEAPSQVTAKQLNEVHIQVALPKKDETTTNTATTTTTTTKSAENPTS